MDQGRGLWELLFGVSDPDTATAGGTDFNHVKMEDNSQTNFNSNFQMDLSEDILALLGDSTNNCAVGKDFSSQQSSFDLMDINPINVNDLAAGLDLETLNDLSAYLQSSEFHSTSSISSAGSEDGSSDNLSAQGSPKSIHSSCSSDEPSGEAREELVLSKEELVLLKKEGLSLPKRYPLTKQEERTLKKIRRKIRNKKSAQESRRKKKVYMDQLEDQVKDVTAQNKTLQKRVKELEKENVSLQQQLRTLQNIFGRATRNTKATGTCLMALVLSVALIVSPYTQNSPADAEKEIVVMGDYPVHSVAPVRTRVMYNLDKPPEPRLFGIPLAKDGFRLMKEEGDQQQALLATQTNSTPVSNDAYMVWKEQQDKLATQNQAIKLEDSQPTAAF